MADARGLQARCEGLAASPRSARARRGHEAPKPGVTGPGPRTACLAWAVLLLCAAGCGVPGETGPADTFGLDLRLPVAVSEPGVTGSGPLDAAAEPLPRGAVVFFVDGLNARIFEEMLTAGELPAIRKYFLERGAYCPRAVANTPSVTLANETSFVTGRLPGHHGITGINWFDRTRLIWRNYETIAQKNTLDGDHVAPTIYEYLHDATTFSLFFQAHRGATKFVENWASAGPPFFFGWYEYVDRLSLYRFHVVAQVARAQRRWPAFVVAYMLAPDFRGYGFGVRSQRYRRAIRHADFQIGRVLGDFRRAGLLDKLVFVLTSDHGLGEVKRHFPLERFCREDVGLKVAAKRLWERTPFEARLAYYSRYGAVLYGSGDRYWGICLRKPLRRPDAPAACEPWVVRPDAADLRSYPAADGQVDLPAVLARQEAVDVVAYAAGPDRVRVRGKAGEVEFSQPAGPGGPIAYAAIDGADPLGWRGKVAPAALAGQPLTGWQWLRETIDTTYPDLPEQIVAYFRAHRAADLAVFAAPGWDLATTHRAGHGGLRPADMFVPLLLAGPGVPKGRIKAARTVDVVPTVLKLLRRPVPPDLDGRDLLTAE